MAVVAPPRPGYVYVFSNPSLTGWNKVGHTYRPPHRRAAELSRTALPHVFETAYARFFWDAQEAERSVHRRLEAALPGRRRREFFPAAVSDLRAIIDSTDDPGHRAVPSAPSGFDPEAPWAFRVADDDWERSTEGLEEQWGWAEERLASGDPGERRRGWRSMERLSSSGWPEASWRLADALVRAHPNPQGAERAAWVAEAAEIQGLVGGNLRAAWLRSWAGPEGFGAWLRALEHAWNAWGSREPGTWPHRVVETLEIERSVWTQHPARQQPSAWWDAWPSLVASRVRPFSF